MKFEEALVELRKGKEINIKGFSFIFSLNLDSNKIVQFTNYGQGHSTIGLITAIVHGEWEIVEKPGKTFAEVFEDFKEGKIIRRKEWGKGCFICKNTCYKDEPIINLTDLLATDWEVIE